MEKKEFKRRFNETRKGGKKVKVQSKKFFKENKESKPVVQLGWLLMEEKVPSIKKVVSDYENRQLILLL